MDGALTEIFLGVTVGSFSPLAVIAAWEKFKRTRLSKAA